MGVKDLSKKIRDPKDLKNKFVHDVNVKGKRIGLDVSILLHQAMSNKTGAGERFVVPPIPNSEVERRTRRMCSLAKKAKVTLVVCIDGIKSDCTR